MRILITFPLKLFGRCASSTLNILLYNVWKVFKNKNIYTNKDGLINCARFVRCLTCSSSRYKRTKPIGSF